MVPVYPINVFWSDDDKAWIADVPDLTLLLGDWRYTTRSRCRGRDCNRRVVRSRDVEWSINTTAVDSDGQSLITAFQRVSIAGTGWSRTH